MNAALRRARPALGTLVEISVEGLPQAAALQALEAAFAEVAAVQRCMSFHAPDSDLARLHRAAPGSAVRVDARTHAVLRMAHTVAAASHGAFDITVAAQLVRRGALPRPASPFEPAADASWRDVELLADACVRLRRPLWIDLGGIAKGYAVDAAIEVLARHGAGHALVNAGGDLRTHGARAVPVFLRVAAGVPCTPQLELADGAIASSAAGSRDEGAIRAHLHGVTRAPVRGGASVAVIARHCMLADALTKVVLAADAACSARVLAAFHAHALVHDPAHGFQRLGRAA